MHRLRHFIVAITGLLLISQSQYLPGAEPNYTRQEDVIYGRKHGLAMTLDVFTPKENAKGIGVILVVSGGWFSAHEAINLAFVQPMLDRGYTVFAVVHGSQPKFTIPEAVADLSRAVRFIRHKATEFKVDPNRIGIMGGSAGGHLSLMQGTTGGDGNPAAKDPVETASSRVQAVACFFPPTDFFNYGKPGENALGQGVLAAFRAPFDFQEFDVKKREFEPVTDQLKLNEIGKQISPVYHVTADDAPTLIIHGDADKLVPIQQAELILEKLKEAKVPSELVVRPGQAHGWKDIHRDISIFADWFDKHLTQPPLDPALKSTN